MTEISTPLLVIVLAVVIVTITGIYMVWIKPRKSTNHNQDTEQQDGSYATLMRQQLDVTSNHPTDVVYAVLDESETIACIAYGKTKKEGQMKEDKQNVKNPPNSEETKRQVVHEDMYAVINKQQKKKPKEDTPLTHSNTNERVYYKKEHVMEGEEVAPQIPPHTIEKLYTAVVKKPKSNANQLNKKHHFNIYSQTSTGQM